MNYIFRVLYASVLVAVHNSGIISGAFMNSGTVRCGSSVCRPISSIFAKNPLPNGYVHVATIPAGASNITITELKNSINFLAMKSSESEYVINGDYTVSPSGNYEVSGAICQYHRFDGSVNATHHEKRSDGVTEWITCDGPLYEPVHLMVLSQQSNPGIKYEYLLPVTLYMGSEEEETDYFSSAENNNLPLSTKLKAANFAANNTINANGRPQRKRKYMWKVVSFTPCSKSCGGGIQHPIIKCSREHSTKVIAAKRCAHLTKPVLSENLMKCSSQPCPAFWSMGDWTDCRCGEQDEKKNQSREVKCVQELISGVVIQVNSGACLGDRPLGVSKCECLNHLNKPKLEVYKHSNRQSIVHNQVTDGNTHKTHHKHRTGNRHVSKRSGTWLTSEWNEQCSSECGVGQQYRTIFCDRSPPNNDRCDLRQTPETTRECTSKSKCSVGDWFIGPWGKCSGDCFNSTKSRQIFCIKDNAFVEEAACSHEQKPKTIELCESEEMRDCKPKWHYSEWTECNKPCGSGTQRRTIKCLEPIVKDNMLRESNVCKYSERPIGYRACNTHDCSATTTTTDNYDPRVDLIQNDASCQDEFPNCKMVIKAKLCGFTYYSEHCCQSCRLISNEIY